MIRATNITSNVPADARDTNPAAWLGIDIGGTSVKAALLRGGAPIWTAQSIDYARPDRAALVRAIASVLEGAPPDLRAEGVRGVGMCAPGMRDPETGTILRAVNLPALEGLRPGQLLALVSSERSGRAPLPVEHPASDALAAAVDYWALSGITGRLLAISLGTGVGAAVLDDGRPLAVTEGGSGHIGQIDVSMHEPDQPTPIGPDGGSGSLEAYMGLPALRARFGAIDPGVLARLDPCRPPLAALVRTIRIAHAIYRPHHVVLLGGIGLGLSGLISVVREQVDTRLTAVARPCWTLNAGLSPFHAACGAARLAEQASGS